MFGVDEFTAVINPPQVHAYWRAWDRRSSLSTLQHHCNVCCFCVVVLCVATAQACILAVGGGVQKAVFEEEFGGPVSDTPVVATVMTVTMSCDR